MFQRKIGKSEHFGDDVLMKNQELDSSKWRCTFKSSEMFSAPYAIKEILLMLV
jgi:hypothetical protein